jgi:hypothetical protein
MSDKSPHEKGLFAVMTYATAISFGILGAIIVSMRGFVGGDATFEFSYKTVLAFLAGAFVGFAFWRGVRRLMEKRGG